MPRTKGSDGRCARMREHLESAKAHQVRSRLDLQLVELRIRQAIRREAALADLLQPAIELAENLLQRQERYQEEISRALDLLIPK